MTSWKGSDQVWVWSLLSRLWREEEKELGVPRDMMGTLAGQSMAVTYTPSVYEICTCILAAGTTLPLVGASQSAQGMPPLPSSMPSAAIIDIAENIRAKIYALCTKIGEPHPGNPPPLCPTLATGDYSHKILLCQCSLCRVPVSLRGNTLRGQDHNVYC